jgi:predicted  nucleic acid-binding Zn-ribbon protein
VLLIAGAAIGIWAAPRIAPHLPAGMAPVADWLSPRDPELENRIAALEAETGAAVTELRAEVERLAAETGDTADLDARLAAIEAGVEDRIGALGEDLAALDGAETRDRLSRLEAAVEGHQETLTSLRDQLAGVDVGEATAQQFDAYEAELAGMRGEFRDVAGQVGTLSRRIDEVAAQAERQIEIARTRVEEVEAEAAAGLTRAEIEADLAEIRSALAAGAPYEEPVERLATRTDAGVPDGLPPRRRRACRPSPDCARISRCSHARHPRRRAGARAGRLRRPAPRLRGGAGRDALARPREGDDADAILSRMEAALRQDDLGTALSEAEALPPEASTPCRTGSRPPAPATRRSKATSRSRPTSRR